MHRRALGHHGDVMVGVLGECRRRDDDRGVVGGRRARQHLEGGNRRQMRQKTEKKKKSVCPALNLALVHTAVLIFVW